MDDVRRPWAWLAAIMVMAAAVRLHDLDGLSLWNDELFSRYYPRMGQAFLWGPGRRLEPTPPLYYSLLAGWMGVFGESAAAMRLLSVAASLPGIVVVYVLGQELFGGARAGLLGALCLALSATNVFYAQEARSYALEGTAIAVALLGMARFLRQPKRGLALYAVGAAVAVYCHITAVLFVAAANLVVVASLAGSGPLVTAPGLWRWSGANLAVALVCLPLLSVVLSPAVSSAIGWMEPLDRAAVIYAFATVIAGPAVFDAAEPVALAGLVILGTLLLVPVWRPGRRALSVAVATPVLFFALMTLASLRQPLLMLRTVAWLSIPLSLTLGGVLARRSPVWTLAVVAPLCAALGLQITRGPALKEDWRGFLQALAPRLAPPAMVVLSPSMPATAMAAYASGVGPLLQVPGTGPDTVESVVIPQLLGVEKLSWEELRRAIGTGRPVWMLIRGAGDAWLREHLAALPEARERVAGGPGMALRW